MKLIIDIPDELAEKEHWYTDKEMWTVIKAAQNGTPIPDNATNGEVLKTMFMPNRITRTDDIVHIEYDFTPEWWNSPYQKGDSNEVT